MHRLTLIAALALAGCTADDATDRLGYFKSGAARTFVLRATATATPEAIAADLAALPFTDGGRTVAYVLPAGTDWQDTVSAAADHVAANESMFPRSETGWRWRYIRNRTGSTLTDCAAPEPHRICAE